MTGYDVVVVGSGSAGGTLADRLSADEGCRVALLEAGPDFPGEADDPPGFYVGGSLQGERYAGSGSPVPDMDWGYLSEALPNGRRVRLSRGRLMGGSSMTNGCVAVRARPRDMDAWATMGAHGWGWDDVVAYFELVERELSVMRYDNELFLPVQRLFLEAAGQLNWRYEDDLNEPQAWDNVVGPWPRNRRNEVRQGTLNTYIRRARPRANLTILAGALVDRVLIAGTRASGVRFIDASGTPHELKADRVVLAAGAYGSAPILLRSGIGPAGELAKLGIKASVDLPVGSRLLDHPGIGFPLRVSRVHARMGWPSNAVVGRGMTHWVIPMAIDQENSLISLAFFLNLTDAIDGRIAISSPDPTQPPVIDHGYWPLVETGAFDGIWEDLHALLETGAMRDAGVTDLNDGVPLRDRLLQGMGTGAHPAGGCGIGSVVDTDLQVLGIERLAVADASVFPRHVTNNPNLTVHVVAEVAADRLRRTANR